MSLDRAGARFLRTYGDDLSDRMRDRDDEMFAVASCLVELQRQHVDDAIEMRRVFNIDVQISEQLQLLLSDMLGVRGPRENTVPQTAVDHASHTPDASDVRLHYRSGALLLVRDASTQC